MTQSIDNNSVNQFFIDQFEIFEKGLNGQSALAIHQTRKDALQLFSELGIPSTKSEEYKYTNIGKVLDKKFEFEHFIPETGHLDIKEFEHFMIDNLEADLIVFINGKYNKDFSSISNQDGIEIIELQDAFEKYPEAIASHYNKHIEQNKDCFSSLNTAFTSNGVYVHVKKGKAIDKPIAIYYITDTKNHEVFTFPRNLIVTEESSEVQVVEIYGTVGNHNSFTNAVTEFEVGENANVHYNKIGNDAANAYHVGLTKAHQANNSTFNASSMAFGGGILRNNLRIIVDGEGCSSNMNGLYLLDNKSHVDNHTEVDHRKPNSFSNELYKGILDGKSTGVFNGKIFVRQDAQKTNAFQSNKNILLTDTATVNTKPQLEIWADDVKCSHGCTTGQLDDDAMFYLRSRGIDKESARAMLLYAFAVDVLDNVKIKPLKKHLDRIIAERFNQEIED